MLRVAAWVVTVALLAAPRGTLAHRQDAGPAQQPQLQPNYSLAARFMPAETRQLVFDTSVTAHWFTHSDRFWFSYKTTQGTDYYLVDPDTGTRRPLWDNAKVAEQLSLLTAIAYDAQHLGIQDPQLVDDDTAIRFYVQIRADAVLPGTENPSQPHSTGDAFIE